jgi:cell division protein FtsZ
MREMGSAMMGTGEASGDKRALRSADEAISNPLMDDVSLRGARGVLISITGGKDLTLYEVDEAATRIREEVDADANIIVGATFDESLDGIIRVSVVATGVEIKTTSLTASAPRHGSADVHEAVIAELAQQLKAENARSTEPPEVPETWARRAVYHS